MNWLATNYMDIIQVSLQLLGAASIIVTFTKTKKDDTVVKYIRDFLARLVSLK